MTSDRTAEATRESTRGVAIITVAKAYFMVAGLAQQILLTRIVSPDGYGLYASVLNLVSILNNVVVTGSIQAMSKGVSEQGEAALRRGLVLHVALGGVLGGTFALLARPIGLGFFNSPRMPPLLAIGAVVVADYCVYAALVGAINGRKRFEVQALLDMTFATLRTGLVLI